MKGPPAWYVVEDRKETVRKIAQDTESFVENVKAKESKLYMMAKLEETHIPGGWITRMVCGWNMKITHCGSTAQWSMEVKRWSS